MGHLSPSRLIATFCGLYILVLSTTTCSSSGPAAAPVRAPELWGDLKPVVSVKELMRDMLDPIADNIFDSVKVVETKGGTVTTEPKTDEDWEKIRIGAVTIAEGVYLLKIRRPFAPPGDLNNSTGPDAVELAPAQITAKVEKDPVEWNARIEALRNVGLEVLDIVKRKDVNELWDASQNLDEACEACHKSYWYPGEDAKFYDKLNRRLQEMHDRSSATNGSAKPVK
jgi:cytochrome c556